MVIRPFTPSMTLVAMVERPSGIPWWITSLEHQGKQQYIKIHGNFNEREEHKKGDGYKKNIHMPAATIYTMEQ